jgi:polyketide cyclase/dehydrase/lipid transport protein
VADYRFLTTWLLDAPREAVWDEIYHAERWPQWWAGVEDVVKVVEGDEQGVGSVYRNVWRSRIPYAVRFDARTTRVEQPHLIELTATGELEGTGRWRLFAGDAVAVTYEWNVHTTAPWMNALAPLARPVFEWNHHYVMRRGAEGLARRLGARLVALS